MTRKKVCLINPPTTDPREIRSYFPMALLTLGGVLKQEGWEAALWDFDLFFKNTQNTTVEGLKNIIRLGVEGARTNIFGISAICSNFPMALWMAKEIKSHRKDALIILGGPQPSSVPEEILRNFEFIDVIVVGEGEKTLEEMARAGFDRDKISALPGVCSRIDGRIVMNEKRTLTEEMDTFPFPDYSLIDFRDYSSASSGKFLPQVEVGRGCPFHCTFCSTALMWEKNFRVKSPERILQEMEHIHREYGFTDFEFIHDNFTTSRKFVLDFCDYMIQNNGNQLKWSASSRTDCLDIPRIEKMKAAGLWGLFFGLESGSNRMQGLIKKNLDFDRFLPILKRGNEIGISITTAFILGFPEESEDDMDITIRHALNYKALGTNNVYFSKLTALTGTQIYRDYLNRLEECFQSSTVSPQLYGIPMIHRLIREHRALFSSYYHIPHPQYSAVELTRFVEFAYLLVGTMATAAIRALDAHGLTPNEMFRRWDAWAENMGIPYYNYRAYGHEAFRGDFTSFLDTLPAALPKIRPSEACSASL